MVVVRCLILCSKFAKNRFSAAGAYSAPTAGVGGTGRGRKEKRKGGEGRKREGGKGKGGVSPE